MKKPFYLYLLFNLLFCLNSFSAHTEEQEAEASNFKVNNTDSLEVLSDRLILQGNVSITSLGEEADNNFTLSTSKLVSLKTNAGEYGDIECFGISNIKSSKFTLKANKLFFRKDLKTKKYTRLEAFGNVNVVAKDSSQNLKSPKVFIDLINKKLMAYDGVKASQVIEDKGKKQRVDISSVEQEIDLNSNLGSGKQLIARKSVITSLEGEANIFSEKMELYKTKGQMEKAVFTGTNTYLLTKDKIRGDGDPIIYYLQSKVLNIMSPANSQQKAKLTKPDGTIIEGDFIEYGTETKSLKVRSKNSEKSEVKTADGATIRGDFIEYGTETKSLKVRSKIPKNQR
jgi:lipopolysaccharide transport protein LptA